MLDSPDSESLVGLFSEAGHIAVLTGAGISTASGIPDFESTDRDWPYEEPREVMLSALYWRHNPRRFWEAYRHAFGKKLEDNLEPTEFHHFLAELESLGKDISIITQNVDGLHQKAGSSNVIEAHGNSSRAICLECRQTVSMESLAEVELPVCSSDQCIGLIFRKPSVLKPDVSLFFEGVYGMGEFREALESSDFLLVAGTRLNVGPINELPFYAMGTRTDERSKRMIQPAVWVSNSTEPIDYSFTHKYYGDLEQFPKRFGY